jgi:hypothetical protein
MFFKPLGPFITAMNDGVFWPHYCKRLSQPQLSMQKQRLR